ncbi:hypothetical protein Hanom_Chr05g00463151 [Helianthus anomalus]
MPFFLYIKPSKCYHQNSIVPFNRCPLIPELPQSILLPSISFNRMVLFPFNATAKASSTFCLYKTTFFYRCILCFSGEYAFYSDK